MMAVTCALLALALQAIAPAAWHPDSPGTHCAICQAASMPFVADSVAVELQRPVAIEEPFERTEPSVISLLVVRHGRSRAPPA
jgi:hypothetical protein